MVQLRKIVRIAGTDLLGDRDLGIALRKVKGVDFMFSNAVLKTLGIGMKKKVGELSNEDVKKIEDVMKNPTKHGIPKFLVNRRKDRETGEDTHIVSSELTLKRDFDLRHMKKMKSYKGIRHATGLKVRGQRTKSTGRRGVTMGVKRKKKR
jgi:small subunit ribosomal protein S13